ncbi:nucleotidyltransferase domain-containing protein [Aestuariimicrobium ganziense]|uniref:nucleotidyltransferase domain-containing protein n=1 Tax=Aestuariimicrobium ganziense TaxID=2773677 RepID=UPI0019435996|nr:nucleotidyltransferase domain-containing protein [Aestuariimicrobium ganziense]
MDEARLQAMADDLVGVPGVVGVSLGGSRARGDAVAGSDVDLGVHHGGGLDLAGLNAVAARWSSTPVEIGPSGSWGPWVDHGGWLTVDEVPVDWIVRDLRRVDEAWGRACEGRSAFHTQPGHPFGFWDAAYCGELALSVVLADPSGELGRRREACLVYPEALREQMVGRLWEADFDLGIVAKGVSRGDATFVMLCLSHALMICAHALHAAAGVWVTNEKGLVPGVERLPGAPRGWGERASAAMSGFPEAGSGSHDRTDTSSSLAARVRVVRTLVDEARAHVC